MSEERYTPDELRKISDYLAVTMSYTEFCEFFHNDNARAWGYFENICRWIEHNPTKARKAIEKMPNELADKTGRRKGKGRRVEKCGLS